MVLEGTVEFVRTEVGRLSKYWDRAVFESPANRPGLMAPPVLGPRRAPAGSRPDWPDGHGVPSTTRDTDYGLVTTIVPFPANGMNKSPPYPPDPSNLNHAKSESLRHISNSNTTSDFGSLPNMKFPQFDGDNPQLWMSSAQDYFDMYSVGERLWVKVARMHCVGAAACWIQSIESRLPFLTWQSFCELVHERFSRDQRELLVRQLFHIKQTSTVTDYVERFVELIDQLSAYTASTDPLYYTMRFIDGLRDDIRSVVLVHRPPNLNAACTLALLQDEATDNGRRREFRKSDSSPFAKGVTIKGALPLPPAPPRPLADADDKKTPATVSVDDKLAKLRSSRRARGLCIKCAAKWHPGHKCSTEMQLHVLQEIFDVCHGDELELACSDQQEASTSCTAELFFVVVSSCSFWCSSTSYSANVWAHG